MSHDPFLEIFAAEACKVVRAVRRPRLAPIAPYHLSPGVTGPDTAPFTIRLGDEVTCSHPGVPRIPDVNFAKRRQLLEEG